MEERFYIFSDSAGTLKNSEDPVIVLATLVVSESQLESINKKFISLKSRVAGWGIDTTQPEFEFHTSDIFRGSGIWRNLGEDKKMEIAKALRATLTSKMHFAMVVIHKGYGGARALGRFHRFTKLGREEALSLLPEEQKNQLWSVVQELHKELGFGPLGDATGLLFGLTTGLMHWEGIRGEAKVTIDNQFVKQVEGWELLFKINAAGWPELAKRKLFPLWPKDNQPDWHLGSTIYPEESYRSYGLQMIDFIAYTTKRIRRDPFAREHSVAVVNEHDFFQFYDYRGIDLVVSHKASRQKLIRTSAVEKRGPHHHTRTLGN